MLEKFLGSTPSSDNPLVTNDVIYKKVVIHYWEDYNTGKHHVLEVDIGPDFTVEDLMLSMITYLDKNAGRKKYEIVNFVMRLASKDGLPKLDMPVFEISQKVQNVEFVRFSLCDKALDEKTRLSMKELVFTDDEEEMKNQETKENKQEKPSNNKSAWKKIFCCFGA